MNSFLNLYKNNPTAGGTDGTVVSNGDNSAPLTFILDATLNETQSDTIALRCESGYQTATDVTISAASDTNNHWAFSLDGNNWSDSITITDTITTTNKLFYVQANSSNSELPQNDDSVKIRVQTKISAT